MTKKFLFIVLNTEALVKGSEESVIVACLYSRACALLELPNAPVEF